MDNLKQFITALSLAAMLSPEAERIKNPVRDDVKYENYIKAVQDCDEFAKETGTEVRFIDPDFPMADHRIWLIMPTTVDDLDITAVKGRLANVLNSASGCIVDTENGNVRFFISFEDVYTSKGD